MPRILIVDDDANLRILIRQMLEPFGFEIDEAEDGRDAMCKFRVQCADLVLCDIFMPEKNGIELLEELPREFLGVKIIVMSGGGFGGKVHMLQTAQFLGAAAILHKPFEQTDLLEVIQKVLPAISIELENVA